MSIVEVLRSKFCDIPKTPTPWVMEEQWSGLAIKPAGGARHTIAKIHGTTGQDLADALFVLDAVNAHDELVAALELVANDIYNTTDAPDGSGVHPWSVSARTEKALYTTLQKARGTA